MAWQLGGRWTYRSYRNNTALVNGDAQAALANIFGEGVFELTEDAGAVAGTFDMGGGFVLDIRGTLSAAKQAGPLTLTMAGFGRDGTPTQGWRYDYHAYDAFTWPNGVAQVPAIVGTVIRTNPHGGSPAGFVASFIAVQQS